MSDRLTIFDTTLRDGEQSPGATMNRHEKVRLAGQLDKLGVDVIEAGFPASSQGDFEAVQAISQAVSNCQVAGLCRSVPSDIDRAWQALQDAPQARLHTFVATSDIHMRYKLGKTRQQVLDMASQAIGHAAAYTSNVEFSAEDASRSDWDFLVQVVRLAVESGATTINIPDTVGYSQPREFTRLLEYLQDQVPALGQEVVLSVHCHNDLGLAVANTLAAVEAGARQAEVTLSGIGERAGNASLEEVVMNLEVRQDQFQVATGVKTEQLYPSCRLLSLIIGQPIPPYKPIIGNNAFAHESGIHQHGMLKNRQTYEIMTPESVGRAGTDMVLGKHSGKAAIQARLGELGYGLDDAQLDIVVKAIKDLADKKKRIHVEDLEAVVLEEIYRIPDKYKLNYLNTVSGNMAMPTAALELSIDGEDQRLADFGVGPIDAVFNSIAKLTGRSPKLVRYSVNAITGGTDALGEVTVRLEEGGYSAVGRGSDPDVIMASARAYLNALNRLAKKEEENICAKL